MLFMVPSLSRQVDTKATLLRKLPLAHKSKVTATLAVESTSAAASTVAISRFGIIVKILPSGR
ncbi:hypothetical protein H0B56_18590 [Haloechinothrix sp. YIM 98757]|uniref:Uncharacterized protein n=1 Tax=Haloechinothrix aidingensis TaxID=2752311 RepID=A0A838AEG0_9PSEU|nr:hypothetical protein [Haloechinothrix aidingensis]MBA0127557.1 hypothetical protein [Haloechinothrix aidingensis]